MSKTFDQQETGTARPGRTNYGDANAAADKGVKDERRRTESSSSSPRSSPPRPSNAEVLARGGEKSLKPPSYTPPSGARPAWTKPRRTTPVQTSETTQLRPPKFKIGCQCGRVVHVEEALGRAILDATGKSTMTYSSLESVRHRLRCTACGLRGQVNFHTL
jgi:hypothetical protein